VLLADGVLNLAFGIAATLRGIAQATLSKHSRIDEILRLAARLELQYVITDAKNCTYERVFGRCIACQYFSYFSTFHYIWSLTNNTNPIRHPCAPETRSPAHSDPVLFIRTTSGTTTGCPSIIQTRASRLTAKRAWIPRDSISGHLMSQDMQLMNRRSLKLGALRYGKTLVVRNTDTRLNCNDFPDYCNGMTISPSGLRMRLAYGDLNEFPSSFLLISGSDRVSTELRRAILKVGNVRLGISYGTSQSGTISWLPPEALLSEVDSVGWPLEGVELLPVGPAHTLADGNEYHEYHITKKGATINPNDLLRISNTGQIIFGGRSNDVFNFCSLLVSPHEIEDVIMDHPAVRGCIAFGAESTRFGSIPMAAVMLDNAVDEAKMLVELMNYAKCALGIKYPRQLIPMKALPVGNTGKSLRRVLAKQYALRS